MKVALRVKWGKEVFDKVEIDTASPVSAFKSQLKALTGVPQERQKIMCKNGWKGLLKDDFDLSSSSLKDGMQVMLMGTAEVVTAPKEKVLFVEDMKEEKLAKSGAVLPSGLINLGNTCYMNSTLQCLRKVPELRFALSIAKNSSQEPSENFAVFLRETFDRLDRSTEAIPPMMFLHCLRQIHTQFAQQSSRGQGFMQQDAEELYSALLNTLKTNLKEFPSDSQQLAAGDRVLYKSAEGDAEEATVLDVHNDNGRNDPYYTIKLSAKEKQTNRAHLTKIGGSFDLAGSSSVVDALFGIELREELSCLESGAEPVRSTVDRQFKLLCNIRGGAGSLQQVSHMEEGIRLGLMDEVEMNSDALGRSAKWKKCQKIARLPRYICVQFIRFYWKATPDSQDHAGVKCKIMKPITFPETFDAYEFCTDDLKKVLDMPRLKAEERTKLKEGQKKDNEGDSGVEESKADQPLPMETENLDDDEIEALKAAMALSKGEEVNAPGAAGPGLPWDFKGNYELFAVVTHKGREAEGGHYMGWVRVSGDDWVVFDDADVSPCKTEDILKLKGGGDWHMAYLVFYRYKD